VILNKKESTCTDIRTGSRGLVPCNNKTKSRSIKYNWMGKKYSRWKGRSGF